MSEFQTSESSGSRDEGIQREGGLRDKKRGVKVIVQSRFPFLFGLFVQLAVLCLVGY